MQYLRLKNGELTQIDDIDADLAKYKWRLSSNGYVVRGQGIYLHRVIMKAELQNIDHKDRNKLNNCRSNLRIANRSQNQANRNIAKNSTTGYRGVSWSKKDEGYHARLAAYGKRYSLGMHKTPELAAEAYNRKAIELFGEFAALNDTAHGNIATKELTSATQANIS